MLQSWQHFHLHHSSANTSFLTIWESYLSQSLHLNASDFSKHPVTRGEKSPPTNPQDAVSLPPSSFFNITELYNHPVVVLSPQTFTGLQGWRTAKVLLILDRNLTLFRLLGGETVSLVVNSFSHRYKSFWPGKFNSKTR